MMGSSTNFGLLPIHKVISSDETQVQAVTDYVTKQIPDLKGKLNLGFLINSPITELPEAVKSVLDTNKIPATSSQPIVNSLASTISPTSRSSR